MQKLILVGGGGHCRACIDVIEQTNHYEILGILDRPELVGTSVLGHEIIGTDDNILRYIKEDCQFLITIGQIKTAGLRKKIFQYLEQNGAAFATIISDKAYISNYATVGKGTIIMHHSIVNASAVVGENCILNTGCDIEHDVIISSHTHVSTHAVINGGCMIGNEVFIGSNATISNQIVIKDKIVIGSGSVVNRDLLQEGIYVGNPARRIGNKFR